MLSRHMFCVLVFVLCLSFQHILSFQLGSSIKYRSNKLYATNPTPRNLELPEEIKKMTAINDMILVERLAEPEKTTSGLFMPKAEGKDKMLLGVVLSIPSSDEGTVVKKDKFQSNSNMISYKKGDVVLIQDHWGIGPKHIQIKNRYFSFHKAAHILGLVKQ